jgi:hypothetical protein
MGNPSIPHLFRDSPVQQAERAAEEAALATAEAAATATASGPDLTWNVYFLREQGKKLSREAILRTHRTGQLTIKAVGSTTYAYLNKGGNDFGHMHDVRVRQLKSSGGLLIYGTAIFQTRFMIRNDPQAWWCTLVKR